MQDADRGSFGSHAFLGTRPATAAKSLSPRVAAVPDESQDWPIRYTFHAGGDGKQKVRAEALCDSSSRYQIRTGTRLTGHGRRPSATPFVRVWRDVQMFAFV